MLCENGRSSDEAPPAMIQDAVAAAIEDGTTMDEIVARIRVGDGDGSPSAADRIAERLDGLIHMLREADRCAEEWVRTREPGTESRASLVAIEALRTLALVKMADLGARAEPVPAEDLARLALALFRIESADRLRIERERAMAEADTHAEPAAAPWAGLSWDQKVGAFRRSVWEHFFPQCTYPPPRRAAGCMGRPALVRRNPTYPT